MSFTIVGKPDKFAPVFNPIYFYVDSSLKNEDGFKYVMDIYSAKTQTKIGRYKLFPRPVDGYGVGDINQLLSSQVSFYLNQDKNIIDKTPQNNINYDIVFGQEYVNYWTFITNNNYSIAPFVGYTMFSGLTAHSFVVGDSVLIEQASGFTSSIYNGIFSILAVTSNEIIVDLLHSVTTPTNGGTAVYSDKHKTIYMGAATETGYTAFNGSVAHQNLNDYTSVKYNLASGASANFLTNMPNNYILKNSNKMWLNYYSSNLLLNAPFAHITTRYGNYDMINYITGTTDNMQILPCGPANIASATTGWTLTTGTHPVIKNTCWDFNLVTSGPMVYSGAATAFLTDNINNIQSPWYNNFTDEVIDFYIGGILTQAFIYATPSPNQVILFFPYSGFTNPTYNLYQKTEAYSVYMLSTGGTFQTSQTKNFVVDWSTTRYGNIELYFIDRLGSMIPVNFELQSNRSINISRSEYQTLLGNLNNSKWSFDSTERGRHNINTTVKTELELNSNWMSEQQASYMQELYTSQAVYIKEYGKLWPVIITSNSYDIKTKNNKKNIQIKIKLEMAFLDRINNI